MSVSWIVKTRKEFITSIAQIEAILNSSVEDNRERILGNSPVEEVSINSALIDINGLNEFDRAVVAGRSLLAAVEQRLREVRAKAADSDHVCAAVEAL